MNFLNDFGYICFALPKAEVKPFHLLSRSSNNGVVEYLNGTELNDIFVNEDENLKSKINKNKTVPDFGGNKKLDFNIEIGSKFLFGNFPNFIGNAALKTSIDQAKKVIFSFENILEDRVRFSDIDAFISEAKVNEKTKSLTEKLRSDDIFIITSILKSNNFKIMFADENEDRVNIDLNFTRILDSNFKYDKGLNEINEIKYQGDEYITFAIKAIQIIYDKKWFEFWKKEDGNFRITNSKKIITVKGLEDENLNVDILKSEYLIEKILSGEN